MSWTNDKATRPSTVGSRADCRGVWRLLSLVDGDTTDDRLDRQDRPDVVGGEDVLVEDDEVGQHALGDAAGAVLAIGVCRPRSVGVDGRLQGDALGGLQRRIE